MIEFYWPGPTQVRCVWDEVFYDAGMIHVARDVKAPPALYVWWGNILFLSHNIVKVLRVAIYSQLLRALVQI